MSHKVSSLHTDKLKAVPSPTKIGQVSNLHNWIQEILGDTHHTFLQGSYRNDTAISDINDVDIVAIRLTTYSGVHSPFATSQNDKIQWDTIFTEIENKLLNQKKYSWTVTRDDKCIIVKTDSLSADVVPAVQFHIDHLEDPIVIHSFKTGVEKINHPRLHWQNGVAKNKATDQNYKPTVRVFKNWICNHFDKKKIISSYHMESLVHYCEDKNFSSDPVESFIKVGNEISELMDLRHVHEFPINSVCGLEDIVSNWEDENRIAFSLQLKHSVGLATQAYNSNDTVKADYLWRLAFNM